MTWASKGKIARSTLVGANESLDWRISQDRTQYVIYTLKKIKIYIMKVFWLANTPCGAGKALSLDIQTGGWLTSLEKIINAENDIDLYVSFFYWDKSAGMFKYSNTTYIPIIRASNRSKIQRFIYKSIRPNNDLIETYQIKRIVDEIKPDIIHVHGTEGVFGLIQMYTDVPVVISIQGLLLPYSAKMYSGVPADIARRCEGVMAKVLLNSASRMYRDMSLNADREKTILKHARFIIGRTSWDNKITRMLAPSSIYFKGDEIMRDVFYNNKWKKERFGTCVKIVTVMSSGLYKGLETVVETARILKEYHDFDFKWVIIGQKYSDYFPKLVGKWKNVKFSECGISLVGIQDEYGVAEMMIASDIYCQASHIENSPNSVCEAMLLGMPIIATFAGGTETILKNGEEGVLVQAGDQYSLAASIIMMSNDFDLAAKMGDAAYAKATIRHDKQRISDELISTYKEIIRLSKNNI